HQVEAADVSEPMLERASALLRGALRRQVANDADEAALAAAGGLAHRERHGECLAVCTAPFDLAALADDVRLTRGEIAGHVAVVLTVIGLAHQHADVLADDVGGRMTEHAFGGAIEREDLPAIVDHDD